MKPEGNDLTGSELHLTEAFIPDRQLSRPAAVRHVRDAIVAYEPQIVHTTLFDANTAGRLAARRKPVTVLTSLVNTPYSPAALVDRQVPPWKRTVVRSADRFLSRHFTDHFHAISDAVADSYRRDFGLPPSAITVVPRGRSRDRLGTSSQARRTRVRQQLGVDGATPLLLTLGRQEAQKGHRVLLEAAHLLRSAPHPPTVLIGGREGGMTDELRSLHSSLGLGSRVRFLGLRDDVGDLLAAADLFVFPSLYEGLGGAMLEAMAMNLPIVASDVPALREVLDDGRAGILVPPADPASVAEGVTRLLADPALAGNLASHARERFESQYSLEASTQGMVDLYARLVGP